ncbi:ankyrin-3 [Microplitis demolitor]|uniref:ankyrin-3 n=1 Tax=Microplitis demolitor TaxID=69319 RepID=UPI0004CCC0FB|nr:ankyrin-3 [Microplitis demolitor]XP_014299425.1 ankyrin-3 [Microplitis demolitor]XP_014299426.1 ankyrin-3 [Microplitis demolitor]XP_014299427.1 ankyrin-3 [Microplitis demolitor]XP_014299428.1 ankyrin-3 [Microplitis demolitor]XP_014299431.1 ankyrin-3 [Microplitis demolitor]XP_014299432.1 ankyrin-3 [Microplitis demolitor]XP_014299433.1 ankyrin-3 [Microplitis demolitor]XP_014299434.1 ankyrin-3 [Microplitis demolitor]XP_014299435.1 ankyrin-3 [Microplitis demolitor]XP_014299436.1 ankyrin-3 
MDLRVLNMFRQQRLIAEEIYKDIRKKVILGTESVNTRVPSQSEGDQRPTILHCAIDYNDDDFIEYLLNKENTQVNLSIRHYGTALHHAIDKGRYGIVYKLVDAGADVNIKSIHRFDDSYPLQLAVRRNHYCIAQFLVSRGADVQVVLRPTNGFTRLRIAVREGKEDMVKFLIENGANVHEKSTDCESLLIDAVRHKNDSVLKYLLESGIDPNSPSNGGCNVTPLHIAVDINNAEAVQLLLNHDDIDINRLTSNGNSVLDYAIFTDNVIIVRSLLLAGIDFNKVAANYFDDSRSFCDVIPLIRRHIVKLSAANLYVMDKKLHDVISSNKYANNYRQKCYEEVGQLKKCKISETNFSFYDVLHRSVHKIAQFLSYVDIDDDNGTFDDQVLKAEFPLYGGIIFFKLHKARQRKNLLGNVDDLFFDIFTNKLPDTFVRNISRYFSNRDLKQLNENMNVDSTK